MAVPKRRHSNSRSNKRRSHHHKKPRQLCVCPRCSHSVPTHTICPKCGFYGGRVVVQMDDQE